MHIVGMRADLKRQREATHGGKRSGRSDGDIAEAGRPIPRPIPRPCAARRKQPKC